MCYRGFNLCSHLLVDGIQLRLGQQPLLGHPLAEEHQAVLALLDLLDLIYPTVRLGIPLKVTIVAVELALNQRRTSPFTGPLDRFPSYFIDCEEVVTINYD